MFYETLQNNEIDNSLVEGFSLYESIVIFMFFIIIPLITLPFFIRAHDKYKNNYLYLFLVIYLLATVIIGLICIDTDTRNSLHVIILGIGWSTCGVFIMYVTIIFNIFGMTEVQTEPVDTINSGSNESNSTSSSNSSTNSSVSNNEIPMTIRVD